MEERQGKAAHGRHRERRNVQLCPKPARDPHPTILAETQAPVRSNSAPRGYEGVYQRFQALAVIVTSFEEPLLELK
jgi:hypothetical protein